MNRRSFIARLFSLAAFLPYFGACAPRQLKVGIHPWIGYETLYLARDFDWLPTTIALHEGKTARDSLTALAQDTVDAACLTLDETLRGRGDGIPLTVALVFDVSVGADVVLARSDIQHLSDLAGKRLGLERSAVGALVLEKLLEAAALPESALTLVDSPVDQQISAWRNGAVDALITYEPTADWVLHAGGHRLFDSRQMPETIFDVLAVRTDRAEALGTALEALVASHFLALEHMRISRQDAIYRIAAHQGLAPDDIRRAFHGVVQPSLAANQEYLAKDAPRLMSAAKQLSTLMVKERLLWREDDLDQLMRPDWLPRHP